MYLFETVYPNRNKAVDLVMPCMNTEGYACCIFLQKIPKGRYATIVSGQATWHANKRLKNLII